MSEQNNFKVGDVVAPRKAASCRGPVLYCGSGTYSSAVVGNVEPFVLVSKTGDMVWRKMDRSRFFKIGNASWRVRRAVLARLAIDNRSGRWADN